MSDHKAFAVKFSRYGGEAEGNVLGWTDKSVSLMLCQVGPMSGPSLHMSATEARALAAALLDAAEYAAPVEATASDLGLEAA